MESEFCNRICFEANLQNDKEAEKTVNSKM